MTARSCDKNESFCVCALDDGHEADHRCECGGEWNYDDAGRFVPVSLPGLGVSLEVGLGLLFGGWGEDEEDELVPP